MKAVVYDRYGAPDVLRLADVPIPEPTGAQVLVDVVATSLNLTDWEGLTGSPLYARVGGLRRPARQVLGSDIAGRVVAIGPDVDKFQVGDAVYGDNLRLKGGFAEYTVAPESVLAPKPEGLSFAKASTIPQAGPIALQGTSRAGLGTRLLINGAGGGTGTLAIQLAKRAGAHVTGVDNGGKLEFMRSVGADEVIDYQANDFTKTDRPYDLILDLVARRSVFAYRGALAPRGRYLCVGGTVRAMLRVAIAGAILGLATNCRLGILAVKPGPSRFTPIADRCLSGEVSIHIDRTFPLDAVPEALAYIGMGRTLGKVVVEQA